MMSSIYELEGSPSSYRLDSDSVNNFDDSGICIPTTEGFIDDPPSVSVNCNITNQGINGNTERRVVEKSG